MVWFVGRLSQGSSMPQIELMYYFNTVYLQYMGFFLIRTRGYASGWGGCGIV